MPAQPCVPNYSRIYIVADKDIITPIACALLPLSDIKLVHLATEKIIKHDGINMYVCRRYVYKNICTHIFTCTRLRGDLVSILFDLCNTCNWFSQELPPELIFSPSLKFFGV